MCDPCTLFVNVRPPSPYTICNRVTPVHYFCFSSAERRAGLSRSAVQDAQDNRLWSGEGSEPDYPTVSGRHICLDGTGGYQVQHIQQGIRRVEVSNTTFANLLVTKHNSETDYYHSKLQICYTANIAPNLLDCKHNSQSVKQQA